MKTDFKSWGYRELIIGFIIVSAVVYFFWISMPVPKGYFPSPNIDGLKQVFAAWGATCIAVYCGTTKSSKDKDDTIASLTKKDNSGQNPDQQAN